MEPPNTKEKLNILGKKIFNLILMILGAKYFTKHYRKKNLR